MKTLGEFIVEKQHEFSHATGELTALLSAIKLGAKIIHRDINKAGLVDILGASGAENVQGEVQQKLDLFANEKLKAALKARDIVAGIASEEEDERPAKDAQRTRARLPCHAQLRHVRHPASQRRTADGRGTGARG